MTSQWAVIAQTLALLGSAAGILLAFAAAVVLLLLGRRHWARVSALSGASLVAMYGVLLFAVSATSATTVLPPGAPKVFCEIDCHVAFDLADSAWRTRDEVVVTVRETFDPTSVGPRRGDGPLTPGTRRIQLVDDDGHRYAPIAVRALGESALFAQLRPGESHRAQLRFSVPESISLRGLLIEIDDPVSALLIGHERSPFHGKVLLDLGGSLRSSAAGARRSPVGSGNPRQPTRNSSSARA
jgi:hypothetical protein